jgi:light-regulated signal transduction histidine kinase (bacteriophytochrome)
MEDLIEDLLKLSRLGRADMQFGRVDLTKLVSDLAAEIHQLEPARQVEWKIQPGLRALHADARLLRAALENLLRNAWKFTGRQPHPVIEFGRLESDTFYVRDNGAGFDMTYAGRLFGVFQRLHPNSEFPGTGVGLATVQRIITRHGGRTWAEGAVGKGATFYFTLPG